MKITTTARSIIVLNFFLVALSLSAQVNLVPNPSFEEYTNCPVGPSEIYRTTFWEQPTEGTCDYFNECCVSSFPLIEPPSVGIPYNQLGIQAARTGSAYAGIIVHEDYDTTHLYREYLQVRLINPMITGNQYLIKFFVSLSDFSSKFSNGIGAYFSTTQIQQSNHFPFPYTPQINASGMINNYEDWTEITETFTPDSAFEYLTIGNFYQPFTYLLDTFTAQIDSFTLPLPMIYYYIDDVSVISLDTTSGLSETEKPKLKIFPNPASNQVTIEQLSVSGNQLSVEVYDALGRLVTLSVVEGQTSTIPLNLSKGVYLLRVKEKEEVVFWEKLMVE